MSKNRKVLSFLRSGFAETDWFSGIRIPRESSADELSYTAQCIEVLRPLLPLNSVALLFYAAVLAWKNSSTLGISGASWLAASLALTVPPLLARALLTHGLRANQISTARIMCLVAIAHGVLLGCSSAAFANPLLIAATLGCLIIGMVIYAALPLAEMVFLASFVAAELSVRLDPIPPSVAAYSLLFSFGAIWIAAHVQFIRAKTRMELQKARLSLLSSARGSFLWQTDVKGHLAEASEALFKSLARPPSELIGAPLWALVESGAKCNEAQAREIAFGTEILRRHHQTQAPFGDLVVGARARDAIHSLVLSGRPRYDSSGSFLGFLGVGMDLTEFGHSQERLLASAQRDALTQLMNRACFNEGLEEFLCKPSAGHSATTLMLIDLDKFKQTNDTLGHQVGDQLLRQFSERLRNFISSYGFAGRLGGDEFGVVLHEISDVKRVDAIAGELVRYLSAPYDMSGLRVSIGAAIGIAIGPEHGDTVDALVRNADLALYSAKARGGNTHRFFDATLLDHALERRQLEIDLGNAIENGELSVYYQPIVDTCSERICGFEALAHWHHPKRGDVSPDEFIPLAETAGLINRLGEWVLRQSCLEAAAWPPHIRLAVNLSPLQFVSPGLTSVVVNSLAQSGLSPDRLEIEITENVFLEEADTTQAILRQLHDLGIRWTLDDFGTGYSSLKYLLKAPFSKIKIDRDFVNGLSIPGSQKRSIVATIVALANSLGLETTAEGVESHNDLKIVRELGCSQIQGFIYGSKMHAREARVLANSRLPLEPEGYDATRCEPRMVVLRSADIHYQGNTLHGTVRNVSSNGTMIEADQSVAAGSRIEVHMDHDKPRSGVVRWSEGLRFGVEFDEKFQSLGLEDPNLQPTELVKKSA